MASGLLSLKWNNHRSTFFHVLSSIRSKESYCDATLACDGRFYPVHKLVLSTCSEYFEQIFERTQCKHPVIVLKDIKFDDLEALMNYMYVGEVNVLQEKLAGLIKAAECLKIKGLAVPDEDPLSIKEKRNQIRVDIESPHAKRRRRDDSISYEERERHVANRNIRLSQRDHQQISQLESRSDLNPVEETNLLDSKLTSDNHVQSVESEPEPTESEHQNRKQRSGSGGPLNQRPSSQKPIPELSIDETSVKAEPPDIHEEEVDSKETLHSNLGYDPSGDGDSVDVAGPESVASGSNEAGFSDSNVMEAAPQSVEDVVAQAIPPSSSNFQGNSFSLWEGEGSLQNFPGEGFSGENSQGRPMIQEPHIAETTPTEPQKELPLSQQSTKTNFPSRRLSASPKLCISRSSSPPSNIQAESSHSGSILSKEQFKRFQTYANISSASSLKSFAHSSHERTQPAEEPPRISHHLDIAYSSSYSALNNKNTTCRLCNKAFSFPVALKLHMRTHTGEKPFACPYCSYRTSQKGNLTTHVRTHTGEEPFGCSICSCRFKSGSALNNHLRTRHP